MKDLSGRVAAVTGAASGIGRALAVNLATEGCHVAAADLDSSGLAETVGMLEGTAVKATSHIVDVSKRDQVNRFAEEVVDHHGKVNIIINNAGVALSDTLADGTLEDFEWLIGINFWGVVYGTKTFLPYLIDSGEGHVVNVSSLGGFHSTPYLGAYCTRKFAVRGFTETLYQELKGSCVGVTSVHPGGINTSLARNARYGKTTEPDRDMMIRETEKLFITTSDQAAKKIIRAIRRGKPRLIVGRDAQLMYTLGRLFPVSMMKLGRILSDRTYGTGEKLLEGRG
jgi:NAD(P)-dependent dehydrogenase (short-subunit alcohol dehydrogenase family)